MELTAGENDDGRRLDRILRRALPDHPLPLIHRLLRQGKVLVNGKPAKAQDRICCGAKIFIPVIREQAIGGRHQKEIGASKIPDILWEGLGLIAVNKEAGISVHGNNSLDTLVRSYLADKLPPSLSFTPGPLHRLDKPTSGVVVFSENIKGARLFSSLMRERKVKKTYLAVIEGALEKEEIWQDELVRDKEKKKTFILNKINDKNKIDNAPVLRTAITKVTPLASDKKLTLVKAEITTGRTHQIRAQAASHGYPLFGDIKYGSEIRNEKYGMRNFKKVDIFLHAWKIEFLDYLIEAPLPQTWIPMASRIASTNVLRSGSLPDIPGISTSSG